MTISASGSTTRRRAFSSSWLISWRTNWRPTWRSTCCGTASRACSESGSTALGQRGRPACGARGPHAAGPAGPALCSGLSSDLPDRHHILRDPLPAWTGDMSGSCPDRLQRPAATLGNACGVGSQCSMAGSSCPDSWRGQASVHGGPRAARRWPDVQLHSASAGPRSRCGMWSTSTSHRDPAAAKCWRRNAYSGHSGSGSCRPCGDPQRDCVQGFRKLPQTQL